VSEPDPCEPPLPPVKPGSAESKAQATGGESGAVRGKRRGGIRALFRQIKKAGRDAASVALGKLLELPPEPNETDDARDFSGETKDKASWRVSMLHVAAERLRGAADSYIAAKLDEIEARVDAKLDHVEARIDAKIIELHKQLRQIRDRELRHRLRLLKITLIFTVLVAILSLVYKWLAKYLVS
jgi:hypothetical protein